MIFSREFLTITNSMRGLLGFILFPTQGKISGIFLFLGNNLVGFWYNFSFLTKILSICKLRLSIKESCSSMNSITFCLGTYFLFVLYFFKKFLKLSFIFKFSSFRDNKSCFVADISYSFSELNV